MAENGKRPPRKLSTTEWLLVGMLAMGILLVALRWEYISKEVSESVRSYFERSE